MLSFFKSYGENIYFGDYKKPKLLMKLEEYQNNKNSWEYLGVYIDYKLHASITPLDVIPFAGTGGDGVHFGFLTDFGNEKNLDDAPIVCVSSTNDPPVRLVANNLKDFFRIVSAIGEAEFLDEFYDSDEEITTRLKEWDEISETTWDGKPISKSDINKAKKQLAKTLQKRDELRTLLKNEFAISPMDSIVSYLKRIKADRAKTNYVKDSYDIGVRFSQKYSKIEGYDYEHKKISQIEKFFDKASKPERILFYRNSTYHFILSEDYDIDIKNKLIIFLKNDGYSRESKILKKQYK